MDPGLPAAIDAASAQVQGVTATVAETLVSLRALTIQTFFNGLWGGSASEKHLEQTARAAGKVQDLAQTLSDLESALTTSRFEAEVIIEAERRLAELQRARDEALRRSQSGQVR